MHKKIFFTLQLLFALNFNIIISQDNSEDIESVSERVNQLNSKIDSNNSKLKYLEQNLNQIKYINISSRLQKLETDVEKLNKIYELKKKITDLQYKKKINKIVESTPWILLGITKDSSEIEAKTAFINKLDSSNLNFETLKNSYKNFLKRNNSEENFESKFEDNINQILKERKDLQQKQALIIEKENIMKSILSNIIFESLIIINEANKINALSNKNRLYRELSAMSNIAINSLYSGVKLLSIIKSTLDFKKPNSRLEKSTKLLGFTNSISNIIIALKDLRILKDTHLDYRYMYCDETKLAHYIWIAINKLTPYILFAKARNTNDNIDLLEVFEKPNKLTQKSIDEFNFASELANTSENIRKYLIS